MFRFKQFTIQQDRTAMKVCTDACVLGAYADVAVAESNIRVGPGGRPVSILDIGTGTGLLAMMAAQRNPTALIDAVEVDEAAFAQATENAAASPFARRIKVVHTRIQNFQTAIRYDRILTNPPFYSNSLRSPDTAVNRALHTDELPFAELIEAVIRLMKPDGQWWVLLPPYETQKLAGLAKEAGLCPFRRLFVRHNARKSVFRIVTGFSFGESNVAEESLDIRAWEQQPAGSHAYTTDYQTLLRDFYLIF